MAKQSINPKLQILNKKDCVGFLLKFNSLVHIGIYCYLLKENIKLIIPFEAEFMQLCRLVHTIFRILAVV